VCSRVAAASAASIGGCARHHAARPRSVFFSHRANKIGHLRTERIAAVPRPFPDPCPFYATELSLQLRDSQVHGMGEGAMGFRFRRSIRLVPGLRLNVGLKSASVSTGIRGLSYTAGSAGQRITVGLPGTGLYWTKAWRNGATRVPVSRAFLAGLGILVLLGLTMGALIFLG
jgi:hypothetical protein